MSPATSRRRESAAAILLVAAAAAAALLWPGCARRDAGPATEQVFRFRLREDPPTLDPARAVDNLSEAVLLNVFRGLVELDPATLAIRPAVAASWTISPDHRVYTFTLRDDVVFHNGRKVGAADVAYSFMRLLRKETNAPRRFILEPIAGAAEFTAGRSPAISGLVVKDPRTVEVRLARPFAPFLGQLTMAAAAILPREVYEDPSGGWARAPSGCGPFRFVRWEQSNFIELRAFDAYYGGRPAVDRVVVRIIENLQSALQEYRTGGLDSLDELPRAADALHAELAPEIHRYPFIGVSYIGFNHALAPFRGNPDLRKAFNYAVDKEYIWRALFPEGNTPANGIIPPGISGHDPDLPGYPHDPARARSLLARAGFPGGAGLPPIALWINTSEDNRTLAQQIQADLKAIGVDLAIREVDWGSYITAVEGTRETPGQAQMFRFGWYLDYPDADAILRPQLTTASFGPPGNHSRYSNARFDSLVERALELTDPNERAALYREAERIAVMDDAAWLLLGYYQSSTLFKPYVQGIVPTPLGEFRIPLERLRIARSRPGS